MDNKTVYNAICNIDEEQLNEFEENCSSVKKRKKVIRQTLAASLCFAAAVSAAAALGKSGVLSAKPQGTSPTGTKIEIETSAPTQTTSEGSSSLTQIESVNEPIEVTAVHEEMIFETAAEQASPAVSATAPEQPPQINSANQQKGGSTPASLQDYRTDGDGGEYKVFRPGIDKFEPLDEMTLENRFCSFVYNGLDYYPALNGDITKKDYEPAKLASVKASHWELRSANEKNETSGIVYYAEIDIYKLKGIDPKEAVACVISFNGEAKEFRYDAHQLTP